MNLPLPEWVGEPGGGCGSCRSQRQVGRVPVACGVTSSKSFCSSELEAHRRACRQGPRFRCELAASSL